MKKHFTDPYTRPHTKLNHHAEFDNVRVRKSECLETGRQPDGAIRPSFPQRRKIHLPRGTSPGV